MRITTRAGSDIDAGWTGIAHDQQVPEGITVQTQICCTGNDCAMDDSSVIGTWAGAPIPLSSGGVPVCVATYFRGPLTGIYDLGSGCGEFDFRLTALIFLVQDADFSAGGRKLAISFVRLSLTLDTLMKCETARCNPLEAGRKAISARSLLRNA